MVKASDFSLLQRQMVYVDCDTLQCAPVLRTAISLFARDCKSVLDASLAVQPGRGAIHANVAPSSFTEKDVVKREAFTLDVRDGELYIAGSDDHGLAYGLLEVTRLLGVSPWEWWADVTPKHLDRFMLPDGYHDSQSPDVAFRGIFINDEDWGLMPWSSMSYEPTGVKGSIGPKTYSRVFELLLRLRANTIWPAMHECSQPFFLTPGNREVAERYGIYIGGSHCEPMACSAAVEWGRRGVGDYDYVNNSESVKRFWEERLQDVHGQEILYTLGMRGVHDGAMRGAKTVEEQKTVLTRVIKDQREMLARWVNPEVTQVPQVFIPYKEVLDVYNAGLEVPDDVCLMWCDDNYGYIRHFPTAQEQARQGGNGIYYHVSYWGRPHDYLWLGSMSPYLMYQQLHKGYEKGIGRIWILNVGDIKPNEYQTELFMDMAWDMKGIEQQGVYEHMKAFYNREFGSTLGNELSEVMNEWHRLNYIRKPEHMGGTRVEEADKKYWSTIRDLPWSREEVALRLAQYEGLSDRVERLSAQIPNNLRDAYFQLAKYPVQGAYQLNRKLLEAQRARHGEGDWTDCDAALDSIRSLTLRYNEGFDNGGKWNRMMDCQPRKLPVFDTVPHIMADEKWAEPTPPILRWNGNEAQEGMFVRCEGLGYHQGAAELLPNEVLSYGTIPASSHLEIRLLPSHSINGHRLGLWVQISDNQPQWIDYRTQGRSEEWKLNVLRNQAIRTIQTEHEGALKLWTDCEGVIVDEIAVVKK